MNALFNPNLSCSTFSTGIKQFVVQLALSTISSFLSSALSLTPSTMLVIGSSPFAGAEIITFLAPAFRCAAASPFFVKSPVHSRTTSIFISFQGSFETSSLWFSSFILLPFTTSSFPFPSTLPSNFPCTESYLKRTSADFASLTPLIATHSIFLLSTPHLSASLPILPKPFIATLIITHPPDNQHNEIKLQIILKQFFQCQVI